VLLIMCDQLNASAIGCYGGPVPTPHLDRLAREGVRFTQATCTTPFCSPARASIVTGLYPHRHGIVGNVNRIDYPAIGGPPGETGITVDDATTDKLLSASGYSTHQYGKWHLSGDHLPYYSDTYGEMIEYAREMAEVFAAVRQQPRDTWMDWYGWAMPVQAMPVCRQTANSFGNDARTAEFVSKMGRLKLPLKQVFDVRVADNTVECLRSAGGAPFSITCSLNYPHDPCVAPDPYYDLFTPDQLRIPANSESWDDRFEKDLSRRIVKALGPAGVREFLRIYYATVRLVDDQIGRVLDALDATGRAADTIVMFTSDHGDMVGAHGMVWKNTQAFYDEIVRVPLIIRYPKRIRPRRLDMAASHVDLMPTLLELTDHPVPGGLHGHSLAPYLLGNRSEPQAPRYRLCERVRPQPGKGRKLGPEIRGSFMVRGDGWKYSRFSNGGESLFHLASDPGETQNLAADPASQTQKRKLIGELEALLA
jgi:arylsulfatase A-like enzyme